RLNHPGFFLQAWTINVVSLPALCWVSLFLALTFSSCSSPSKNSQNILPGLEDAPVSDVYLLRVGDIVQVDVFQEPVMTTRQRIQGDGTISVGLIGRVQVQGESVEEAADKIASLLDKKYLVNPQV